MASAKLPANILNGLPLQDADAAAAGGDLTVVGGAISRYFSPAALGINGQAPSSFVTNIPGTIFYHASNYLDLRGMTKFQLLVRRNVNTVFTAVTPTLSISFQVRMGPLDNPTPVWSSLLSQDDTLAGKSLTQSPALVFPTAGLANNSQTCVRTWTADQVTGFAGVAASIGSDVRIVMLWASNPTATLGDGTISAQLWASS